MVSNKVIGLLLVGVMNLFNQSNAQSIKGKVTDDITQSPLPFATIILKKDTTVYKAGVTDSLGYFSFEDLEPGKYNLEFAFINYQRSMMSLFLRYDTVLKNVALVPLSGQLNEVSVLVKKPIIERKSDILVFNVANNVNVIGLDTWSLLAKAPQIRVDDNGISMVGKGTVKIMINDRLLQMSVEAMAAYLKAIPAESVQSIEVITSPPSMYSAEGGSGLINIILKKKRDPGYNGTANANLTSWPSPQLASGISMNYNKKSVRYYSSLNTSKGYHNPYFSSTITYPKLIQDGSTTEKEESQYVGMQAGFDADLTKSSLLGISFNVFYSYPYQTNTIRTLFSDRKGRVDSFLMESVSDKISYYSNSANIHYLKYFDIVNKRRIVFDADWYSNGFDFPNKINSAMYESGGTLVPGSSSQTNSNNIQASSIYSLNSVIYLPAKKHEFYFGGKINFIRSTNDVGLEINKIDPYIKIVSNFNFFSFTENTQALFVNYKQNIGEKWSFQSGLRAENTQTTGIGTYSGFDSLNKYSYFELFPTVYLSYKLSENNTLTFNYGRRINRPGFNNFNPYPQYSSQFAYSEGNPYLIPSISNNFELSESIGNFDIAAQYSFSNNGVARINIVDTSSHITLNKPYNFLSTRSFVTSIYYTYNKLNWLQTSNEFDFYHKKSISSDNYVQSLEGWAANFRSNNSLFFNKSKTIVGGIYFFYQFPEVNGVNKFDRFYYVDVSGKYLLLQNKLQLAFRLSDVFKTLNLPFHSTVNNILTSQVVNNDSRRFTVSVRYTFGNSKLKKGEAHSADSNNNRAF